MRQVPVVPNTDYGQNDRKMRTTQTNTIYLEDDRDYVISYVSLSKQLLPVIRRKR